MLRNNLFQAAAQKKCYARLAEDYESHLGELYFYLNPDLTLFLIVGQAFDWLRNNLLPSSRPQVAGQAFTQLDFVFSTTGDLLDDERGLQASFFAATDNYLEFILDDAGSRIEKVSRVFRFDQDNLKIEVLSGVGVDATILQLVNESYQAALTKCRPSQLPTPSN